MPEACTKLSVREARAAQNEVCERQWLHKTRGVRGESCTKLGVREARLSEKWAAKRCDVKNKGCENLGSAYSLDVHKIRGMKTRSLHKAWGMKKAPILKMGLWSERKELILRAVNARDGFAHPMIHLRTSVPMAV